jgi:hypothetical protein
VSPAHRTANDPQARGPSSAEDEYRAAADRIGTFESIYLLFIATWMGCGALNQACFT